MTGCLCVFWQKTGFVAGSARRRARVAGLRKKLNESFMARHNSFSGALLSNSARSEAPSHERAIRIIVFK
jgi:hypothetical protein